MNARVVAVHAKPGETVDASRALVVLEAMKMEHGLALPAPVRVTAVHVAAGAQVAPGHLLVEFKCIAAALLRMEIEAPAELPRLRSAANR